MSQISQAPHIHFLAQGDGPIVILIHGIAGSSAGWATVMPALISAGYRVYALDLLGHGDSDKPTRPEHYHFEEVYQALETWIKTQAFHRPVFLIGHSLGGHLCLEYTLRQPEAVRAIALLNPFYSPQQLLPGINWLARFPRLGVKALRSYYPKMVPALSSMDGPLSGSLSPEARRQMFIDLHRAAPEVLHILPSVPDLTPILNQVQAVTLVIYGNRDLSLRSSSFLKLASLIPGAKLIKIPGVGHQPHLARPEIVNRYILEFLYNIPHSGSV
jgi:pimeloyl-ACP methyl ester carboxylesterase